MMDGYRFLRQVKTLKMLLVFDRYSMLYALCVFLIRSDTDVCIGQL